jgi:hypothetical protein
MRLISSLPEEFPGMMAGFPDSVFPSASSLNKRLKPAFFLTPP